MSRFSAPRDRATTEQHRMEPAGADKALTGELVHAGLDNPEAGATTAEYGIVMLAAVGFAGLLVVILKSDEVRQMLLNIVQTALSTGA
ncbi:DUF4244 domain-containing protein [Rothia sp. CCM 9417]|uniref:DUF4244 domain-containing protein n=1 Tax=unclassified Rothia (in: high G+C Gram-positive bacteria) TaxID=2689056 RepID=UPI003ADE82B2